MSPGGVSALEIFYNEEKGIERIEYIFTNQFGEVYLQKIEAVWKGSELKWSSECTQLSLDEMQRKLERTRKVVRESITMDECCMFSACWASFLKLTRWCVCTAIALI